MGAKYKTNHERMLELIEQLTKADIAITEMIIPLCRTGITIS